MWPTHRDRWTSAYIGAALGGIAAGAFSVGVAVVGRLTGIYSGGAAEAMMLTGAVIGGVVNYCSWQPPEEQP